MLRLVLTEVYPNIFLNEIALPRNPLRVINSYVIMSPKKNLIVDTGFNTEDCQKALMEGLTELKVDFGKTELFNTHMHTDHSGLTHFLQQQGVKTVYFSPVDGRLYNGISHKESFIKTLHNLNNIYGLKSDNPFGKDFGSAPVADLNFTPLSEGEEIVVGDYRFEAVETPGHTPGHLSLYERKHKLFFCGDHILNEISPNITFWGFDQDVLDTYLKSLKKVAAFEVDYLLTGHRKVLREHRKRIQELLDHHEDRINEILKILQTGAKTVGETASLMSWDVSNRKWDEFPKSQKWFASGEAMSHLEHLVHKGLVIRQEFALFQNKYQIKNQ